MKKTYLFMGVFLLCTSLFATDVLPPKKKFLGLESLIQNRRSNLPLFSIGLKIGIPNIVSLNGEISIPVAGIHIAPFIDYGLFKYSQGSESLDHNYLEYGLSVYLNGRGNGIYGSVSKGSLNSNISFNEISLENQLLGSGSTDLKIDTYNFKLGYKTSRRLFFRFEIGYGKGEIPEKLVFLATASNGIQIETSQEIPKIPGIGENGILIGNIGIGYSF